MKNCTKTVSQDLARLSLINNLKLKIQSLRQEVQQYKLIIESYKRSTKITLLNEQQIEIQKLNDENKRLLLIIQQMKSQNIQPPKRLNGLKFVPRRSQGNCSPIKKKEELICNPNMEQLKRTSKKEPKKVNYEQKYYEVLVQNQKMRKQLIVLRANENITKHKKPLSDGASILMQKKINEVDKVNQKNYELQIQLSYNEQKTHQLKSRVSELQQLLQKAMQINKSMKVI